MIEDEPSERAWLHQTLAAAGYGVETAATGLQGVQRCRSERFDAITLDLLLPDLSGRDVLRTIRSGGVNAETPKSISSLDALMLLGEWVDFRQGARVPPLRRGRRNQSTRGELEPAG